MLSVSAIIPTYNRARYLGAAIESILRQTAPPSEVLVVDDGSKDNTLEVVDMFGARVKYLAKANGGKSSALNVGLAHATGEAIWIFDDDDLAARDALEKMAAALATHRECGFSYGDYDHFTVGESGAINQNRVPFPDVRQEDLYIALMERSFILQGGLLVRRECYDAVGPFDETFVRSQDLEMMLRLARRFPGAKVDGITFHQRQHTGVRGSASAPVDANRMVESWVKHDQRIFGPIYATHSLPEFLPKSAASLPEGESEFAALLQRLSIMARKGLWDNAAQDLRRVGEIARETGKRTLTEDQTNILRRVFDLFSYAPHTFGKSGAFQDALKQMRPPQLRGEVRAALLWSLPFTIGAVFLNRQWANFRAFLKIYFALATPSAVARTMFSKSFADEGIAMIRGRTNKPPAFTDITSTTASPHS